MSWAKIPDWVLLNCTPAELRVYAAIAMHRNNLGEAWPSIDSIVTRLSEGAMPIKRRAVQNQIKNLRDKGMLRCEGRRAYDGPLFHLPAEPIPKDEIDSTTYHEGLEEDESGKAARVVEAPPKKKRRAPEPEPARVVETPPAEEPPEPAQPALHLVTTPAPEPTVTRADILSCAYDGRPVKANASDAALHQTLIDCWAEAVKKPKAKKLTHERRKALRKAIEGGLAPSDVLKALEGVAHNKWLMGDDPRNKTFYAWPEAALRGKHYQRGIDDWEKHGGKTKARRINSVYDVDPADIQYPQWMLDDEEAERKELEARRGK
jgi:hypothetical protein